MKIQRAVLIGAAITAAGFVFDKVVSILFVAIIRDTGWWAYPIHFLTGLGIAACLMLSKGFEAKAASWAEKMHENRLYRWLRKFGPEVVIFVFCFSTSTLVGAFAARLLELDNRRAWKLLAISTAVSSLFWVSAYNGLLTQLIKLVKG